MTSASPEGIGRRDVVALTALGLAAVGIPLWLSAAAGAIGIPSGDDWVYMRGASSLFATGSIDMPGHTAAAVGQLVMVQPLLWLSGGALWGLTAYGLVMGLIAVASTYLLARRFVDTGSAVLVVAILMAFPGFVRETATFMTDVPAYALGTLCLFLGVRWLHGEGGRLMLIASLGTGLLAGSIREFAVAAPAAILVSAWARNRADERSLLAWASGCSVVGFALVLFVAYSIPNRGTSATSGLSLPIYLVPAFMTLAAVLLPAIALGVGRRLADLSAAQVIAGAGLIGIGMVIVPDGPMLGYIWAPFGAAGDAFLSGSRDPVIPPRIWVMSEQLALLAAVLAAALAIRWGRHHLAGVESLSSALAAASAIARSREGPLVLFLVASAAEFAVFGSMFALFDRYLYPLVPAAAILLVRGSGRLARPGRSTALSHAALVWLAGSAFVIAANSFAYDAARYSAGEAAVALGYPPGAVDAGFEWVGYHASGPELAASHDYGLIWYDDNWPSFRPCAVLSDSPLDIDGYALIREDRAAYRQLLFIGPAEPLFMYGSTASGCPRPPAATTTLR